MTGTEIILVAEQIIQILLYPFMAVGVFISSIVIGLSLERLKRNITRWFVGKAGE